MNSRIGAGSSFATDFETMPPGSCDGMASLLSALGRERAATMQSLMYLLEWSDEDVMKTGWDNFLADEEWFGIRSSAKLVGGIQDQFLHPVSLSSEP